MMEKNREEDNNGSRDESLAVLLVLFLPSRKGRSAFFFSLFLSEKRKSESKGVMK